MQFQKQVFKAIQGQAIPEMAIAGHYSQGISRIFQARQYQAIPGKKIRYKEIPVNSRHDILGKAFPNNSSKAIPATSGQDNSRQGSQVQFQRIKLVAGSFHACANIKIFGKSTADNSRQGNFRKHNVKPNNSMQLQEMKF